MLEKFLFATIFLFGSLSFLPFSYGMDSKEHLYSLLRLELSKNFNGAEINLIGDVRWINGIAPEQVGTIKVLGDDSKGNVHFVVGGETSANTTNSYSTNTYTEGWVGFSAWVPAKIALRRVKPGQKLTPDQFITQKINISSGQPREYRGVILTEDVEINGLESIQTILEGQFLISSAVQRVPDVRRGDSVQIHVITGGLTLTTTGTAEEPAYLHNQVRVMTRKNKRELTGYLQPNGVVEVKL